MIRIKLGEVREIGIEVTSRTKQDFVIDAADYDIETKDGELIIEGNPTINAHKLIILFTANQVGWFNVNFKYHIGPEILKARVVVEVT